MGTKKETIRKTYQVRISLNALKNIDEITGFIAFINHQPLNALKVGDKIFETIDSIEKNPYAFKECEELPTKTKMYRKAVCLSWYIIFKIKPFEIVILGIIHKHRRTARIKTIGKAK